MEKWLPVVFLILCSFIQCLLSELTSEEKQVITQLHNKLRTQVQPTSSNMQTMVRLYATARAEKAILA